MKKLSIITFATFIFASAVVAGNRSFVTSSPQNPNRTEKTLLVEAHRVPATEIKGVDKEESVEEK